MPLEGKSAPRDRACALPRYRRSRVPRVARPRHARTGGRAPGREPCRAGPRRRLVRPVRLAALARTRTGHPSGARACSAGRAGLDRSRARALRTSGRRIRGERGGRRRDPGDPPVSRGCLRVPGGTRPTPRTCNDRARRGRWRARSRMRRERRDGAARRRLPPSSSKESARLTLAASRPRPRPPDTRGCADGLRGGGHPSRRNAPRGLVRELPEGDLRSRRGGGWVRCSTRRAAGATRGSLGRMAGGDGRPAHTSEITAAWPTPRRLTGNTIDASVTRTMPSLRRRRRASPVSSRTRSRARAYVAVASGDRTSVRQSRARWHSKAESRTVRRMVSVSRGR